MTDNQAMEITEGLAEQLSALAERITPGEWHGYSEPEVDLPYSLFTRHAPLSIEPVEPLSPADVDFVALVQNNLPTIIAALSRPAVAEIDLRPDFVGSPACKIESYNNAHEDAVEMGYPSITEALEDLRELRATPAAGDAEVERMRIVASLDALIERQKDQRGDQLYRGQADPQLVEAVAWIRGLDWS